MSEEVKNEKHSSQEEVKKPEKEKNEHKPETGKKEEKKTESKSILITRTRRLKS